MYTTNEKENEKTSRISSEQSLFKKIENVLDTIHEKVVVSYEINSGNCNDDNSAEVE